MKEKYSLFFNQIEKYRQSLIDAEEYIWLNPETGYKEWKTHKYLKEQFEKLGYNLVEAGDIPGFYTEIDTGIPGPTVAVFGELDALTVPTHPECDPETKAVHACGHCCQTAALLGIAIALKAEGATDGMCGKIRLIAVPAEELIEINYRKELRNRGIIKYYGGKAEFLYRGYLDNVDITFMLHTSQNRNHNQRLQIDAGNNGFLVKICEFKGKSSHAGGSPQDGHNALYAATTALAAANAIRETFVDTDHIRFHPIITEGGDSVNAIPEKVKIESYIRGATNEAIENANKKINLALAGGAASMNCKLIIDDFYGYMPLNNDKTLSELFIELGSELFGEKSVLDERDSFGTICTDMGDVSTVIPSLHAHIGGASGTAHGSDYAITDAEFAVINSAKFQVCFLFLLLSNGAEMANKVIENKSLPFKSKEEYFTAIDSYNKKTDAVKYNDDGTVTIIYK